MASSIPFDHPSLVLGHVVNTDLLKLLEKMGGLQAKSDAAFEKMNSFIAMRRGLSMTINELVGLGVDITELKSKIAELNQHVSDAAGDYMTTRITNDTAMQQVREEIGAIENLTGLQSPLDFKGVGVTRLPLASDSIKMDVQYFSYGSNDDSSATAISGIESAIRESTSGLGANSRDIAKTASAQINQQRKHHNLAGTLVITASCTHRATAMLEPLNLDVDKALDIWNDIHGTASAALNPTDLEAMKNMAETPAAGPGDKSLTVLTGVNYGSSFVGMVHMVNNEFAGTSLLPGQEAGLQEQMRLGGWMQAATGGFGVDESVIDNVRKLLSTQSISTHANVIVLGAVPDMASAQLQMGVAKLLEDQRHLASQVETADLSSHDSYKTVQSGSTTALKGGNLLAMRGGMMQNLIQGLGKIDHGANKVIDLNTLMTAFTNYIDAVGAEGSVGVPISFLFQKISGARIARLWLDKYYGTAQDGAAAAAKGTPPK